MREFGDLTLDKFFELCESYAEDQGYLLDRVEFSFWSGYKTTLILSRGTQTIKLVTPTRKILDYYSE